MCNTPTAGEIRPTLPDIERAASNVAAASALLDVAKYFADEPEHRTPARLDVIRSALRHALDYLAVPAEVPAEQSQTSIDAAILAESEAMASRTVGLLLQLRAGGQFPTTELVQSVIGDAMQRGAKLQATRTAP